MEMEQSSKIWMNGKLIDWDDAKIHILSHVVHYGSSIFEGARCYATPNGPAIFRLHAHTKRLFNSCKIYRMEIPYTPEQINQAILELIKVNQLEECYIRPLVYRGYETLGVDPRKCPVDVSIAVWRWGKYLGEESIEKGVSVCVSSWNRMAPNTFPFMAKAGGNYMNSQLIKLEALQDGYSEGIALDVFGTVSEGSAQNLFLLMDGKLHTPPLSASILAGITRDSVITLAGEMGLEVIEQYIPREMLYIADELFFTGSAVEVTPISSVDRILIGSGKRGPVTKELQERFFGLVTGQAEDQYGWLTHVV
ncbi:branched-chain amino acid transaminase [Candidatus Zixiibacteriota bacterium]